MRKETLYKLDSKGKVREWNVWVEDRNDGTAAIFVEHGAKDGAMQTKVTVIEEGKNIGRANETTPYEQACSEADSKYNKQLDKGYLTEIPKGVVFRPMLAHRYDQHSKKFNFPGYIQPKLDGIRSNIFKLNDHIQIKSRNGKDYNVLEHLETALKDLPSGLILDGELFSTKLTFQEIIGAIKRDEPNDNTDKIEFWVYDCLNMLDKDLSFKERYALLEDFKNIPSVVLVDTFEVTNQDEIGSYHRKFVDSGYEGSILRNKTGKYKINGRSYDLLKVKDFMDAEFPIVDAKQDKNGEVVFTCSHHNTLFDCKPKGSHEHRVQMWEERDDYIGKLLTIQFFEWTTSENPVPRFPVGIAIRDFE